MQQADALQALKASGSRLTPQRVMILQAIVDADRHLTVDEIYGRAREVYPYMDLATVYRNLQLFKRLRLVTEIDLREGPARYEMADAGRHHHLICRDCGGTFDLPLSYLDDLRHSLRREFQFQPDLDHFAIGGLCAACLPALATN